MAHRSVSRFQLNSSYQRLAGPKVSCDKADPEGLRVLRPRLVTGGLQQCSTQRLSWIEM